MERCDLGRQASVHTTDRKDVGYSTRRIDASTLMFEDLRELASGVFDERHGSLDPGYAACVSEDVRHVCWSHVTTR